jgi:regulator of sigma D
MTDHPEGLWPDEEIMLEGGQSEPVVEIPKPGSPGHAELDAEMVEVAQEDLEDMIRAGMAYEQLTTDEHGHKIKLIRKASVIGEQHPDTDKILEYTDATTMMARKDPLLRPPRNDKEARAH